MFDWEDQELTNIIWGEAGESGDHIVPYPDKFEDKPQLVFVDAHKKEANQETSKKPSIKSEAGVELDSGTRYETCDPEKGFRLNSSWSDESLSNDAKVDGDSVGANVSNDVPKGTKHGTDETAQTDNECKLFQNLAEEREDCDFVDYDWANIGSFADLDNIFSINDPVFGDTSVSNADELWLSTPLSDSSDLALKMPENSSDIYNSSFEKLNEGTSHTLQDVQASINNIEQYGGKNKVALEEKGLEMSGNIQTCLNQPGDLSTATVNELPGKLSSCVQGSKQKRLLKTQTTDKIRPCDVRGPLSSSISPFPQVNNTYPLPMANSFPPLVLSQPQLPTPHMLQQKHFPGQVVGSPLYVNTVNQYPTSSAMPSPSNYEVPPGNPTLKPPAMSPREKIEKLRRRQKMRAMLAIQRQQQQFGNQVKHPNMERGKMEVGPNSPIERDDSNAINMAINNCSVEESVLRRLQDTIANLDTRTRLCIRDSLFRLAQSAMRRQYPSEISSTSINSKDVFINKDIDNHERFTRIPDIETDTNPIDRTVAHLLFHRPIEFSGKQAETPESLTSPNFPYERKESSSIKLQDDPQSYMNTQIISPHGSDTQGLLVDTSENASTNDEVDGGSKMVEASK